MRGKMEHQRIVNTVLSNQFKALESERDRVKVDAAHMEMELHGEIDKLKAERNRMADDFVKNELDRVTWKSKAEKLVEALRKGTANHVSHENSRQETRTVEIWEAEFLQMKEALAEYEK